MADKFRIDDVEYTIHPGPCHSGDNLLCTHWPGANEPLLATWMAHHQANDALRRTADDFAPVAGACDDTVIRQLDRMACDNQLSVTQRKIAAEDAPGVVMLVKPESKKDWWSWGEKGSDPLGLGFWEMDKLKEIDVDPDDQRHKLAVEIAGTRQLSLQGELMIASDSATIGRYDLSRGGVYGGHRLQVFINNIDPGSYRLDLRLNDYRYGRYNIPLSIGGRKVPTCPKPTVRDIWETVLVPLVPRTYASIHLKRDAGHAAYPPEGGFIYLFLDGKLWREVQVKKGGWFADVNLAMEKGRDHRPAFGWPDRTIMTPYIVQGHKPTIEICYAQTQWSWAQIEALGGMAADDPRLAKGPALKPVATDQFPFKRLQPVDLSAYPNFENGKGNVGHCRQQGEVIEARRKDLRSFFDTGLPVVYLHDALGIAESLSSRYFEKLTELRQVVADLPTLKDVDDLDPAMEDAWEGYKDAYYRCAVLAYKVFFDPDTTRDKQHWDDLARASSASPLGPAKTPFDLGGSSLLRRKTPKARRPKIFDTCMKELSRETLQNVLQVQKRCELRAAMRALKKELAGFLQDKVISDDSPQGRPTANIQPDFIPVSAMLADYANLNGPRYGLLWNKTEGVLGFLNHEPCNEDPDLDIAADIAAEKPARPERDPGHAYLKTLFDPGHPLGVMLWPTQAQVDHARAAYEIPTQPEPADGNGLFRRGAFYCAVEGRQITDRHAEKEIKDLAKIVKQSAAHMLWVFKKQWKNIKDSQSKIVVRTLVRFLKATGDPDLEGLHVVPAGSRIDLNGKEHVVLGAGPARFEVLSKAAFMKQRPGSSAMANAATGPARVHARDAAGSVAAAPAGAPAHYADQAPKITRKQWRGIWGKAKAGGEEVYTARTELTVMPAKCRYAISYYNQQVKSAAVSSIKGIRKSMPPVIALMEMLNFGRVVATVIDKIIENDIDIDTAKKPFFSLISTAYYTLDAAVAILGEESVKKGLGRSGSIIFEQTVTIAGKKVVIYKAVGAAVTGLSAISSAWDMISSVHREDYDAAFGYGIAATTFASLSLAKLGVANATIFAGLAPLAVPLLIVGILGTIYAFMATDTELEKWAKHGPFANDYEDRWTHEYDDVQSMLAFEALFGMLIKPLVSIKYSETHQDEDKHGRRVPGLEVNFYTPGYDPYTSKLLVEVTAQRGPHADGAAATVKMAKGDEDYQQHLQPAERQEPIGDPRSGHIIGLRYYYKGLGLPGQYRWRVRARHIKTHHDREIVVPPLLGKSENYDRQNIDEGDAGWAYAKT